MKVLLLITWIIAGVLLAVVLIEVQEDLVAAIPRIITEMKRR